jgi:SPP1 gp7 family putative phage head morphogenesis protein
MATKSQLERTIDAYYRSLTGMESKALADIEAGLKTALKALDKEIQITLAKISQTKVGVDPKDLTQQLSRLQALQAQAGETLRAFGTKTARAIEILQTNATLAGQTSVMATLNSSGLSNFGILSQFNNLPQATLNELVGVLSDGSPVANLAKSFGDVGAQAFREQVIKGIALGLNPRQVAANWRSQIESVSRSKAQTIARTEMMRVSREASRRTMLANADVVKEWQWYCSLNNRTCPMCWAMHGKKFPLRIQMASHPNCRCAMLPVTKTFKELGLNVPEPVEDRRLTTSGETLFRELTPKDQSAILGGATYRAFSAGALTLEDLVGESRSPIWGTTRYAKSLTGVLGRSEARKYYAKANQ